MSEKLNKELFILDLGVGDLVQLTGKQVNDDKIRNHGVVVGYTMRDLGVPSAIYTAHTFSFRYIENGTLAIWLGRSLEAIANKYFSNFHRVFCDGTECIVHERYIFPAKWGLDEEEL